MGRLIPAGTGLGAYKRLSVSRRAGRVAPRSPPVRRRIAASTAAARHGAARRKS